MVVKSVPLLVFLALRSTCSRSALIPASRSTICGESEQAPGAKYSFIVGLLSYWTISVTKTILLGHDGRVRYQAGIRGGLSRSAMLASASILRSLSRLPKANRGERAA